MIRETVPRAGDAVLTGGERVLTAFRMWCCYDCGLEFSMKTLERPICCPRCLKKYDEVPTVT